VQGRAVIDFAQKVDARGFRAENWVPLDGGR
jgi:hypothetical protein